MPPSVVKSIKDLIYWQYAKLISKYAGVILCKNKNIEVVEYALSRSMSPSLISEYRTKLIDKKILKLEEFYQLIRKPK